MLNVAKNEKLLLRRIRVEKNIDDLENGDVGWSNWEAAVRRLILAGVYVHTVDRGQKQDGIFFEVIDIAEEEADNFLSQLQ